MKILRLASDVATVRARGDASLEAAEYVPERCRETSTVADQREACVVPECMEVHELTSLNHGAKGFVRVLRMQICEIRIPPCPSDNDLRIKEGGYGSRGKLGNVGGEQTQEASTGMVVVTFEQGLVLVKPKLQKWQLRQALEQRVEVACIAEVPQTT